MSCCDVPTAVADGVCRLCGVKGVQVPVITVKSLLTADGLRAGVPQAPRFCASPACAVVYFDDVSERRVEERELSIRVHAKHPEDSSIPVCYCFGHTLAAVRNARDRSISNDVRAEVEAGHCACEVKNPKGACCLGDIIRIERAKGLSVEREDLGP